MHQVQQLGWWTIFTYIAGMSEDFLNIWSGAIMCGLASFDYNVHNSYPAAVFTASYFALQLWRTSSMAMVYYRLFFSLPRFKKQAKVSISRISDFYSHNKKESHADLAHHKFCFKHSLSWVYFGNSFGKSFCGFGRDKGEFWGNFSGDFNLCTINRVRKNQGKNKNEKREITNQVKDTCHCLHVFCLFRIYGLKLIKIVASSPTSENEKEKRAETLLMLKKFTYLYFVTYIVVALV